jgi:hypothetical protein
LSSVSNILRVSGPITSPFVLQVNGSRDDDREFDDGLVVEIAALHVALAESLVTRGFQLTKADGVAKS